MCTVLRFTGGHVPLSELNADSDTDNGKDKDPVAHAYLGKVPLRTTFLILLQRCV